MVIFVIMANLYSYKKELKNKKTYNNLMAGSTNAASLRLYPYIKRPKKGL